MAGSKDLVSLLRRALELAMPDLRHYYRVVRKARIERTYASDGSYWADVQPLRNDESVDEAEPLIPRVEIPILWAGPQRGVVCPPLAGAFCDLEYYDGDPNYPRISNFRWHGNQAPACAVGAFVIQQTPGTHIRITEDGCIEQVTPGDVATLAGGDSTAEVGGDKTETIGGTWTIIAPNIHLQGNVTASGAGGEIGTVSERAHRTIEGSLHVDGDVSIEGDLSVDGNVIVNGEITCAGVITAAGFDGPLLGSGGGGA